MKQLSKKLLAMLLSVLMVCTVLPFGTMNAFADAETDLEDKCAEYEQFVVDFGNAALGDNGLGALKTNMYPAYQAYLEGLETLKDGTAEEMEAATAALTAAMNNMQDYQLVTANAAVKIGTGDTQPTSDDYANVIYSDGETNASWDNAGLLSIGGTYSIIGTGQYRRTSMIYYPNTVILNDGTDTVPTIPIIVGVRAPKSGDVDTNGNSVYYSSTAKEYTLENLYENSPKVYLKSDWTGTNDGYYGTSFHYGYTTPQWPHLQLYNTTDYFVYNIAIKGGKHPNPYMDGNSAQAKYWINNSDMTNYAIFKNSICYKDPTTPISGLSTVDSIRWLGTMCLYYQVLWTGAAGERTAIPQDLGKTKIYAINYNILLDAMKKFMSEHKTSGDHQYFTAQNARDNTLGSIFQALDQATSFNPNDTTEYNYAGGIAAAAKKAGDDIDAAIDALDKATLDGVAMGYQGLLDAIAAYEDKMSHGEMFTNMADAYKAYLSAVDYRDAYLYGQRREFDPSLQDISHNLIVATRNMVELNEAFAYEAHSEQAFDSDADTDEKTAAYYSTFKNLLYVSPGPDRVRSDNASDAQQTANGKVMCINTNDYTETYLYIPDAVAVYDGYHADVPDFDVYTVPVLVGVTSQGGGISDHDRYLYAYYINESNTGLHLQHDYWITRAYEDTDPDNYIDFNGDYHKKVFDNAAQTMTTEVGSSSNRYDLYNKIKNGSITGLTQTYIETASLNELLNKDTILESQYCINAKNNTFTKTKVANMRSDHGGNVDDPENYYANVLKFDNPYDENDHYDSSENFTQFYHHYNTLTAYAYGSTSKTSKSSSSNRSGTLDKLGLYVINFKPVVDLIVASSALVRDEDFNIMNYQEGNLLGYFEDFDKLTSVSPSNKAKYQYDNDSYTDSVPAGTSGRIADLTGHDAAVQQNAYDMWSLFGSDDPDVKLNYIVDENGAFDQDYIDQCQDEDGGIMDYKTVNDGDYEQLVMSVVLTPEMMDAGTCQDGVWWNRYDAAVAAGRQAFSQVADTNTDPSAHTAHKGFFDHDVITYSYLDDDGYTVTETITYTDSVKTHTVNDGRGNTTTTDISGKRSAIEALAEAINVDLEFLAGDEVPRTRHEVKFDHRKSDSLNTLDYDVAIFECANDDSHTDLYPKSASHAHNQEADISVYNALDVALSTIDYERFTNDNIIQNAERDYFDPVLTDKGEPGQEPQDMVDEGISATLEAINLATNGDYDVTYSVKFQTVTGDGATPTVVSDESAIAYSSTRDYSVESGTVYKWVIETLKDDNETVNTTSTKLVDENAGDVTNAFKLQVQNNVRITAYILPETADNKVLVKVNNAYGKTGYAYLMDDSTTINAPSESSVTENGKTTYTASQITLGSTVITPDDAAIKLSSYTNNSFALSGSVNGKQLSEVANNDVWSLSLNATKNSGETCTITYNGTATTHTTETELITLESEAENFVAIAVKNGDKYIPVSYNSTMQFYSNKDMELVDITTTDHKSFYANGTLIDGDEYFYYALRDQNKLLPFVFSTMGRVGTSGERGVYSVYSYYANTNNINVTNGEAAVKVIEVGTVISRNAENLVIGTAGVQKFTAPKSSDCQFSNTMPVLVNAQRGNFYARGYVKYVYTFVDSNTNDEGVIQSIIYSDVCSSEGLQ